MCCVGMGMCREWCLRACWRVIERVELTVLPRVGLLALWCRWWVWAMGGWVLLEEMSDRSGGQFVEHYQMRFRDEVQRQEGLFMRSHLL